MAGKAAPKKNPSALKRVRQSEKLSLRNQSKKAEIKTLEKKLESIVPSTMKEEVARQVKTAVKTIAGAASKGIIHKNTAARKISKIAKLANAIGSKA
ncbi:MAG TPA: 30S ribosomal protein S20 [Dissulfurispiraceae bacterium]|nr:30S ribosomal protein S20 [Dissulfurispiraceae bacterium]